MNALGRHILVEFQGCDSAVLDDTSEIERGMLDAARAANATIVHSSFHHFSPYGVSGVVVIQESHLAIHTWPEFRYAAVDLFTCGDSVDPWVAFDHLKKHFGAQNHSALEMHRGSTGMLTRVEFTPTLLRKKAEAAQSLAFTRNHWFTDRDEVQAISLRTTGEPLFSEKSAHQMVRVYETPAYGKMLTLDGAIMITERDESHTHEMLVHPVAQILSKLSGPPRDVLIIGGGDGGTLREILRYPSIRSVDVIELDAVVPRAAAVFSPELARGFQDSRVNLRIEDGIAFAEAAAAATYDLVLVDSADPKGPAEGLFSIDFFRDAGRILRADGMLAVTGESPMFHEAAFLRLNRDLRQIFGPEHTAVGLFHATTYPSGMGSVQIAGRVPFRAGTDFQARNAATFASTQDLKYYNEEIHPATFSLPSFVRRMIQTVSREEHSR